MHAGHVFDGRHRRRCAAKPDIVIERGIIRDIDGHTRRTARRRRWSTRRTETVMPGLIEMHAHLDAGYGGNFGRIWLAYGITSVRIPAIEPLRGARAAEAFDAGRRPGPRVFFAGDPFDGIRVY